MRKQVPLEEILVVIGVRRTEVPIKAALVRAKLQVRANLTLLEKVLNVVVEAL